MDRRDPEGRTRREVLAASTAQSAGPGHADGQQPGTSRAGSAGRPVVAYVDSFTTKQRKARSNGINGHRMASASWGWTHVQMVGDRVNRPSWSSAWIGSTGWDGDMRIAREEKSQ
jgi:hypothetical protein